MQALAELRRFLPSALLDGAGWERLLARVDDLPAAALEYCGFEFRLHTAEPAADLLVAALPDNPVTAHLIRVGEAAAPDSPAAALARHLRAHAHPGPDAAIELTGLEYDVAETPPGARPPPGVFLRLGAPPADGAQTLPIAALANAVGWQDDAAERAAVDRAVAALPPGGHVAFVGALPGRAPRGVRLIVGGVGHDAVAATLERLGFPGSAQAATAVLAELRGPLPDFRLAVDVFAQGLSPRVGFELFMAGRASEAQPGLGVTWADWLPGIQALRQRGWCVPEKFRGLREWIGLERLYDQEGVRLLHKGLHHVKLAVTAGAEQQVLAKAYGSFLFSRVL